MLRFPIGRKLLVGFVIMTVLSASFLLISLPFLSKIKTLSSQVIPLSEEMDVLQKYIESIKRLENKFELYLTIKSEESRDEVLSGVKKLDEFVESELTTKNKTNELTPIKEDIASLSHAIGALINDMDNQVSTYNINIKIITVNKLFQKFENTHEALQRERLAGLQKNVNLQKEIIDTLLNMFLLIEALIIMFGFSASFILSRLITQGLSKLDRGTREIAKGNFKARIGLTSKDEIGDLARSFNIMAQDLETTTVSKEYVDSIISNMAEALVVVDPDLKIRNVNRATCVLLGYDEQDLIGRSFETLVSTEKMPFEKVELLQCVAMGKTLGCEMYYVSKESKKIPVLFSASAVSDKKGNVNCIVCVAHDITERKKAEEKLKEISEMKSKLVSTVSHELRTPLAAIKAGIAIVTDGLAGEVSSEQKDILDTTARNVNRLNHLIDQFLDFQKLEAGKIQFKFEEVDLNEIVKEAEKTIRPLCELRGLNFSLKLDTNVTKVSCDRDRVMQVLQNLVNNAIKFTKQGSITIETMSQLNKAIVKVVDTGMGMRQDDIPKLFHSFEQLARPSGIKIEGTGLGLAICKDIIDQHGGTIWAESDGENKGSTFIFTLPENRQTEKTGNFPPERQI